jgi:hypothetical protein
MKKVYKILSTKAKAAFRKGTVATLCIMGVSLFIMSTRCTEKEPVEFSFTEYSLAEINCQWTNLGFDNKVIVIKK